MLQRNGEVVIQMVPNVQHVTIQPLITETIAPGSLIDTDEYDIYDSLPKWAINTNQSIMRLASLPGMRMATAFMRSTSTRSKVFGRCFVPGCVRIGAFRKKSCLGTWVFSSSSPTFVGVARRCSTRFWLRKYPLEIVKEPRTILHGFQAQTPRILFRGVCDHVMNAFSVLFAISESDENVIIHSTTPNSTSWPDKGAASEDLSL
jgi:hypothetical protein